MEKEDYAKLSTFSSSNVGRKNIYKEWVGGMANKAIQVQLNTGRFLLIVPRGVD